MSTERTGHPASPEMLVAALAEALARGEADGLPGLLGLAVAEVGADAAAVFARDPERDDLVLAAAVGSIEAEPDAATIVAAVQAVPTLGRTTIVADAEGTAADLPLIVTRGGIELGLGALTVRWAGRRSLGDTDGALLGAFADLAAVALDRSRLATLAASRAEHADRLAMMDALTGLANARTLDRVLELEVARAMRQGTDVSVAVFDIDDFAALNERSGRDGGDEALRQVASVLAGSIRLVDTAGRTGADEFVVVAPGSAGRAVAERIVEAVAALSVETAGRVSVSAGIARFPEDGDDGPTVLGAARTALGTARAAGTGAIAESGATAGA